MPHVPDEQAVEVAVVLHQDVLDELAAWTSSVFGEDPEGFLQPLPRRMNPAWRPRPLSPSPAW